MNQCDMKWQVKSSLDAFHMHVRRAEVLPNTCEGSNVKDGIGLQELLGKGSCVFFAMY